MAARAITGFHRDDDGDWVAELSCGHLQHARHRPPWENRPWVEREAGRDAKLGVELECAFCEMPSLPAGAEVYRRTRTFDASSVPRGLLEVHTTRAGVWGRIVVEEGRLEYEVMGPDPDSWVLRPGVPGVIEPAREHRVRPIGDVRFHVEFLRVDGAAVGQPT